MPSIGQFLTQDHRRCDEFFIAAEDAVAARDWNAAQHAFRDFHKSTERHLAMEEQVLFAAYEAHAGTLGPSRIMRTEHEQMRTLFSDLAHALAQHADTEFLGLSETLMMLMQQHNMKEEQMLYPMCDRLLAAESEDLIERMRQVMIGPVTEVA